MFDDASLPTGRRVMALPGQIGLDIKRWVMNLSIPARCVKSMRDALGDLCGRSSKDRWVLSQEYGLSPKVQSSSEKIGMNETVV